MHAAASVQKIAMGLKGIDSKVDIEAVEALVDEKNSEIAQLRAELLGTRLSMGMSEEDALRLEQMKDAMYDGNEAGGPQQRQPNDDVESSESAQRGSWLEKLIASHSFLRGFSPSDLFSTAMLVPVAAVFLLLFFKLPKPHGETEATKLHGTLLGDPYLHLLQNGNNDGLRMVEVEIIAQNVDHDLALCEHRLGGVATVDARGRPPKVHPGGDHVEGLQPDELDVVIWLSIAELRDVEGTENIVQLLYNSSMQMLGRTDMHGNLKPITHTIFLDGVLTPGVPAALSVFTNSRCPVGLEIEVLEMVKDPHVLSRCLLVRAH